MDGAVRAGAYDDALDLRAYVAKMALLHADLAVRDPRPFSFLDPSHRLLLAWAGVQCQGCAPLGSASAYVPQGCAPARRPPRA